jgi:tartronate-semialdehyde synthase
MAEMTAAEAAVRILESEGVRHLFGIPGTAVLPVYRALKDLGTIRHVIARHEEGAIHMADGYARASGGAGVCIATSGPAATNFVTGLYTAKADSIPVLAITGQHDQMGRESFQAVDITEIVRPIVKKAYYVRDSVMVPWVFREAFKTMKEARPGPVLIDLPLSVQKGLISFDAVMNPPLPIFPVPPFPQQVRTAVDMILTAERPVMLLGGGVLLADACEEFIAVAEALQIPVVTTYMGKSGIAWNHPLMAGHVGTQCNTPSGNRVLLDSTLVFAVGSRFNDRHTGDIGIYRGGRKFIHVDVCASMIGRNIMPDLGIWADAKLTLLSMLDEIRRRGLKRPPVWTDIPVLMEKTDRQTGFDEIPIKPQRVFQEINAAFDPDTVFVTSIGLHQIWSGQLQKIVKPRHYLSCGGAGTLGWDLPASIGAKVARPEKPVVCIVGDYGFQFCMQELTAAVMYDVPFLCIVLNNGYLGLIRQNQEFHYDMDYETAIWYEHGGNQHRGFDFVRFAEACGAAGERVVDPKELTGAFQRGLNAGGPYVVDVILERNTWCAMGPAIDRIREEP